MCLLDFERWKKEMDGWENEIRGANENFSDTLIGMCTDAAGYLFYEIGLTNQSEKRKIWKLDGKLQTLWHEIMFVLQTTVLHNRNNFPHTCHICEDRHTILV